MSFVFGFVIWAIIMGALLVPSLLFAKLGAISTVPSERIDQTDGLLGKVFLIIFTLPYPMPLKVMIFAMVVAYTVIWIYAAIAGVVSIYFNWLSGDGVGGFLEAWLRTMINFINS